MLAESLRHLLYLRRLNAVHTWREAERQQAAESSAAVRRILTQNELDSPKRGEPQ